MERVVKMNLRDYLVRTTVSVLQTPLDEWAIHFVAALLAAIALEAAIFLCHLIVMAWQ